MLVIAIDKFSSDLATCGDEAMNEKSGLSILCKESVRFTHSHTTSTHSAAAIASLLTAQYPIQHNLYRSFDRLSPQSISVAKVAQQNNYVTSFFSGSPFVLKKTGLSDYFDLFDDSIASSATEYDQDFKQQANSFFQWNQNSRNPFFSVIYNSELNRLSSSETDQSGFEKIDEKLFQFFTDLKSNNLWDDSYIIVVGLNGSNKFNRIGLDAINNLHSENTNIATFIKIPRKKGDEGVNWKNDLRINLADLGHTISCLLEMCAEDRKLDNSDLFPILNLSSLWKDTNSTSSRKNFDRVLLVQNTNTAPSPTLNHNFSILYNNYNYIQDSSGRIAVYNTISDKSEIINLADSKQPIPAEISLYIEQLTKMGFLSTPYVDLSKMNLLAKINADYWMHPSSSDEIIKKDISPSNPLSILYIQKYLKQKNLKTIDIAVQKIKTDLTQNSACLEINLKLKISKDDLKKCTDNLFLQYLLYTKGLDLGINIEKNKLLYTLMKQNYRYNINRLSMNLAYNNAWGLYNPVVNVIHPLVFIDPHFFEN